MERLVYDGSDPSDDWIITGIGHSKLDMAKLQTLSLDTYNDYISKCPLHDNCTGHLCKTPSGVVLPRQSLAIDTPVIRNDIARAASFAFQGMGPFHKDKSRQILLDSMKTKTGRLRHGILNCHVDGSLRMVISPHEYDPSVVFIPKYLQDKWKVVRLDESTQRYVSKTVADGDRAIVLRPPTLQGESVQCIKLSFWNQTCLGISPKTLKALKGDYDGDEIHIYPVYSTEAVEECESWMHTVNKTFDRALAQYKISELYDGDDRTMAFMNHTTLSFKQIRDGINPPMFAEQTRTRMEHITGLRKRFDTSWCDDNFIEDSIRGMADTNKQQLSQPIVGDMSRIARIAASCVIQADNGNIDVITESGPVTMTKYELDQSAGNTAMRAISIICAASQQSALDSHRAKDDKLPAHDLISDMIVGSNQTLIIINGSRDIQGLKRILRPQWITTIDGSIFCLCKPAMGAKLNQHDILGSYNPVILRHIHTPRRIAVCTRAIQEIINYHSLPISDIEVKCLACLYSFKPGASSKPVTTREGLSSRKLHWLDVTMGNHYANLIGRLKSGDIETTSIDTASSALVAGNFRDLH